MEQSQVFKSNIKVHDVIEYNTFLYNYHYRYQNKVGVIREYFRCQKRACCGRVVRCNGNISESVTNDLCTVSALR